MQDGINLIKQIYEQQSCTELNQRLHEKQGLSSLPSTEERKTAEEILDKHLAGHVLGYPHASKNDILQAMREFASQQTEAMAKEIESLTEINNINASKLMEAESQLSEAKKEIEEAERRADNYEMMLGMETIARMKAESELSAMRERVENSEQLLYNLNDFCLDLQYVMPIHGSHLARMKEIVQEYFNPTKVD